MDWERVRARHEVVAWRDRHLLDATAKLNELADDLLSGFDNDLKHVDWRDLIFGASNFAKRTLEPRVRDQVEPVVATILERANAEYATLATDPVSVSVSDSTGVRRDELQGLRDLTMTAGPVAAAVGTAAALPALAVSTQAAIFGLATITVVSWPVVAVGGVLAGTAIAVGAVNGAGIKGRAQERARASAREQVAAALLDSAPGQRSVLAQIRATLDQVVNAQWEVSS